MMGAGAAVLIVDDGSWYLIVSIPDLCTLTYSDVLTVDDGSSGCCANSI